MISMIVNILRGKQQNKNNIQKKLEKIKNITNQKEETKLWVKQTIKTIRKKEEENITINEQEIDWNKGIRILWNERNTTKNRLIRKIKKLEKNKIRDSIDKLIASQESNPKTFYKKMRGPEDKKKGIEFVTYTKNRVIKIAHKWKRVMKRTKIFWYELFTTKIKDKKETPYWLINKNKLTWKSEEIYKKTTIQEIKEAINKMANNKATGTDKIPIEIYKDMEDEYLKILEEIYNFCIKNNKMPEKWKKGVIFPIYKKGDESDLTNYRPIALLQTQYKIYSSILNNRMTKQMRENGFFSKYQGAWQKDKITTINATAIINMYEEAKQHNKEIHTTYIDLVKAYDSVEHWSIEQTLKYYNLDEKATNLIMSLLSDTKIGIITKYGTTDLFEITREVRQGDVISLTLFMI
jgi:hypothetical protein